MGTTTDAIGEELCRLEAEKRKKHVREIKNLANMCLWQTTLKFINVSSIFVGPLFKSGWF